MFKEAINCLSYQLVKQNMLQEEPTQIFVDNKLAIAVAKNPVHHETSKHIDVQFHFINE